MRRGRMAAMRFRKLRIAFSAACGVLCLLLIVLWVRSYTWVDTARGALTETKALQVRSFQGQLSLNSYGDKNGWYWKWQSSPADELEQRIRELERRLGNTTSQAQPSFAFIRSRDRLFVTAPHWLLVLLLCIPVTLMWITSARTLPWRFSLRTLLIATTLVAVVLGLVVWAAQ
jgi:hypothetical protein